jgi:predicted nucleic acid-binding protein
LTEWLIDKSALVRLPLSADAQEWVERIQRGLVRITTMTLLEVGHSARSGPDLRNASRRPPLSLMPMESVTPAVERRAVNVQMSLADRGRHRTASVAERAGVTLLHVDKDF